jgi:type II secretory pathway component PulF
MSDFVKTKGYIIVIFFIAGIILFKYSYNKILPFKYFIDKLLLQIPVIGDLVRKYNHYRFAKML